MVNNHRQSRGVIALTYEQVRRAAKGHTGMCYACPVCNGVACGAMIPGPGAKGSGKVAVRNYNAWQDIYLNMDTISQEQTIDTSFSLFGHALRYPIMAAPMGAVGEHFSEELTQLEYDKALIKGCVDAGIAAFTGDGLRDEYFSGACEVIGKYGFGVPTVKPWSEERVFQRIDMAKAAGVRVMCMDIDGSGLPFLRNMNPPSGTKTVEQLRRIIEYADMPFLLKGIMTVSAAKKALDAGASGIVVSNHGGRVLDQVPATAWVLPEIAAAVGNDMTVLIDGGIRTGLDVFKALALGAHCVLVGRPFAACIYGAGETGISAYVEQLGNELTDTMRMCGPRSLQEISGEHLWGDDKG